MRVYRVRMLGALAPSEDAIGQWHVVDRETAQGMSAAAYYFGRDLRKSCDAPLAWCRAPLADRASRRGFRARI
jgi:hypothetical protein